jgi:hypothetical protein
MAAKSFSIHKFKTVGWPAYLVFISFLNTICV